MATSKRWLSLGLFAGLFGLGAGPASAGAPCPPETVAAFDTGANETPESVVIDRHGNRYVSLALTGEIRRIAPDGTQSTHALLPIGTPLAQCAGFASIVGPMALGPHDEIYVSVDACAPANRGVFRVSPDGSFAQIARLPDDAFPNGIAYRHGLLYVADSNLGVVWRVDPGGGAADVWASDPLLLRGAPLPALPGANGIQYFRGELYATVTSTGNVVAFPLNHDGSAGPARLHAAGAGHCDDFAFDVFGNIYCATVFSQLLRIDQLGGVDELLNADDGLDGATAAYFGRHGGERRDLYITNAAFPGFGAGHPSLLRYHLGVPGAPR